jgi:hypothetical protein
VLHFAFYFRGYQVQHDESSLKTLAWMMSTAHTVSLSMEDFATVEPYIPERMPALRNVCFFRGNSIYGVSLALFERCLRWLNSLVGLQSCEIYERCERYEDPDVHSDVEADNLMTWSGLCKYQWPLISRLPLTGMDIHSGIHHEVALDRLKTLRIRRLQFHIWANDEPRRSEDLKFLCHSWPGLTALSLSSDESVPEDIFDYITKLPLTQFRLCIADKIDPWYGGMKFFDGIKKLTKLQSLHLEIDIVSPVFEIDTSTIRDLSVRTCSSYMIEVLACNSPNLQRMCDIRTMFLASRELIPALLSGRLSLLKEIDIPLDNWESCFGNREMKQLAQSLSLLEKLKIRGIRLDRFSAEAVRAWGNCSYLRSMDLLYDSHVNNLLGALISSELTLFPSLRVIRSSGKQEPKINLVKRDRCLDINHKRYFPIRLCVAYYIATSPTEFRPFTMRIL